VSWTLPSTARETVVEPSVVPVFVTVVVTVTASSGATVVASSVESVTDSAGSRSVPTANTDRPDARPSTTAPRLVYSTTSVSSGRHPPSW
jgi:hypothetical protein